MSNITRKKSKGVSILTPTYNDKVKLYRLIDSVEKSNYHNLEMIVIVGGEENTLQEGPKKYPWVKWIDSSGPKDVGQTGRYNLGFAYANSKNNIMMIDSDVVIERDMISKLVERLEKSEKIGIVTPMILYMGNKNWVNQAGANVDLWTGKVSVGWGPKANYLDAKQVQNSGTVMLFKRELVNKIGCFENWYMCYFDPDYCIRATKVGYQTWYEPKAVCFHDQPLDNNLWRPRVLSRAWLLGRNRTLFMRKHGKNLLVYVLFLIPLLGYYFKESLRYKIIHKWFELIGGTIVGFFSSISRGIYIPLPKKLKKV